MRILPISFCILACLGATVQAASPLNVTMTGARITGPGQTVTFDLPNAGTEAALTNVFSLDGRRVAELSAQSLSRFTWDGKDVDQEDVDAGLYVVQIQHGGSVWHGPVLVNR